MGERQFADLSRRTQALGAPITKAAAESMHNRSNALLPDELRKSAVGKGPFRGARKNQAGAVGHLAGFGQELQCSPAERNPMLPLHLHPVGGNRPRCRLEVDFIPPGLAHLARARCGQDQELDGGDRRPMRARCPYRGDGVRNLPMRKGAMVLLGSTVVRQRRADGISGRIVRPVSQRHGPLHDGANPLAHPSRRLGFSLQIGSSTAMTSAVEISLTLSFPSFGIA